MTVARGSITLLFVLLISITAGSALAGTDALSGATAATVAATVETDPVRNGNDAADDIAVWLHPTDPAQSTIIGTDKESGGGLMVYDLAGRELQFVAEGRSGNVDIRYNFPLNGTPTTIVVASNVKYNSIAIYKVNPATRGLERITAMAEGIPVGMQVYGLCMYRSPQTNKYYAFVTRSPYIGVDEGEVQQWELHDDGTGYVNARKVRTIFVGSDTEGCVADDVTGDLYLAQTRVGIWKYGADPSDGSTRRSVDVVGGSNLIGEIEGLSLYYASETTGYLIVSNQGGSRYVIYKREGANDYLKTFRIEANIAAAIDGTNGSDGIEVTNAPLGPAFPTGAFIAHDGRNLVGNTTTQVNSNYKLVPWQSIANSGAPALSIDTSYNPRKVGSVQPPNRFSVFIPQLMR